MAELARTGDGRGQTLTPKPVTIFALSSGLPPAGIAVVRISGPGAGDALQTLSGRAVPAARRATLVSLRSADGHVLDQAIVLWFPRPASATGEDVVELHLHGGRAVIAAVSDALAAMPGLRAAEPGEFTRRAFENGRIDLAQAEALGDLLRAETEAQRRGAIAQLEGGLARLVGDWQAILTMLSARVEAIVDHDDEGDVDSRDIDRVIAEAAALADAMDAALAMPPAERLHDGIRIVVAGRPNAGKSSLINALSGRDVAIVTPVAGTTRDVIEVPLVWDGLPVILSDTAGLRDDAADAAEAIGIARARNVAAAADLVIALDDSVVAVENVIAVRAKADLGGVDDGRRAVSAATGEGIAALRSLLSGRVKALLPPPDRVALNARHRAALRDATAALRELAQMPDVVIQAELLRLARLALGRVTGQGDTEAMLDALFGRFCIGK